MGTHRTRAEGDSTSAYTSEANRAAAGTVNAKFSVRVTRKFPGVPKSVEEFKEKIIERAGVTGVRQLGRLLKIMDTSGEGLLSRKEFKFGLAVRMALVMGASAVLWLWPCSHLGAGRLFLSPQDFGLSFTEEEFFSLWNYFDRDHSDFIDFGEFLRGVRGPMSARRTAVVSRAFEKLDRTGDGVVTIDDLRGVYDPSFHPEVRRCCRCYASCDVCLTIICGWTSWRAPAGCGGNKDSGPGVDGVCGAVGGLVQGWHCHLRGIRVILRRHQCCSGDGRRVRGHYRKRMAPWGRKEVTRARWFIITRTRVFSTPTAYSLPMLASECHQRKQPHPHAPRTPLIVTPRWRPTKTLHTTTARCLQALVVPERLHLRAVLVRQLLELLLHAGRRDGRQLREERNGARQGSKDHSADHGCHATPPHEHHALRNVRRARAHELRSLPSSTGSFSHGRAATGFSLSTAGMMYGGSMRTARATHKQRREPLVRGGAAHRAWTRTGQRQSNAGGGDLRQRPLASGHRAAHNLAIGPIQNFDALTARVSHNTITASEQRSQRCMAKHARTYIASRYRMATALQAPAVATAV